MIKDLNHVLFGGPKWPSNWASEVDIQHTFKNRPNWLVNQDWCKTNGNFLRKWPKTGIFIYSGAQTGPKIGPLSPIFSTHLEALAMSMWSNTDVKPVKTFYENDERPDFWLILDPKIAPKLGFDAHLPYTDESTCNEHVKQYWCKTSENFRESDQSPELDLLWGPKWPVRPILYTSLKVAPMSISNKSDVNPENTL